MAYEKEIADDVDRWGWSAVCVSDTSPPFVYTVGLMFTYDHPELILLGSPDEGHRILAAMVHDIAGGKSFAAPGKHEGVLAEGSIATREVHPSQHEFWLGYAMGYCRERGRIGELRAIQVFWPDRAGRFPFDAGCDQEACSLQPRLDIPLTPSEIRELRRE